MPIFELTTDDIKECSKDLIKFYTNFAHLFVTQSAVKWGLKLVDYIFKTEKF